MLSSIFGKPNATIILFFLQASPLVLGLGSHLSNTTLILSPLLSSIDSTTTLTSTLTLNSTITVPPIQSTGNCSNDCIAFAYLTQWWWLSLPIDTTITAATLLYIVNNHTNTTRTSTIYNDLPSGYTLPPTNGQGTQIANLSWTEAGGKIQTTTMAFPTEFWAYPANYYWIGTLATTDAAGQSICATASTGSYIPFSPYLTPPQEPLSSSRLGDNGLVWTTVSERIAIPAITTPNPNDAAPQLCDTPVAVAPASAVQTASFLTVTSTSHENVKPEATPQSALVGASTSATDVGAAVASLLPPFSSQENSAKDTPKSISIPTNLEVQTVISGTTFQAVPSDFHITESSEARVHTEASAASLISSTVIGGIAFTPVVLPTRTPETSPSLPQMIIDGTTYTPTAFGSTSVYKIRGQTLVPGSTITVGSVSNVQTIALQTSKGITELVMGGSTSTVLVSILHSVTSQTIMINGQTFTVGSKMQFTIGSQTLSVEGSITLGSGSSTTIVMLNTDNSGHSLLIVGTKTSTLASATDKPSRSSVPPTSSYGGVGDYINSGLAGDSPPTAISSTSGVVATVSTSNASKWTVGLPSGFSLLCIFL